MQSEGHILDLGVLTAVTMTNSVLWVMSCNPVKSTDVSEEHVVSICRLCLLPTCCLFPAWLSLGPWKHAQYFPPKYQLAFTRVHGVIAQETVLFITIIATGKVT
jgi:hypothetical protein